MTQILMNSFQVCDKGFTLTLKHFNTKLPSYNCVLACAVLQQVTQTGNMDNIYHLGEKFLFKIMHYFIHNTEMYSLNSLKCIIHCKYFIFGDMNEPELESIVQPNNFLFITLKISEAQILSFKMYQPKLAQSFMLCIYICLYINILYQKL